MTLSAVPGVRVGHAEVPGGRSGSTVVLGPFRGAVKVLGAATGSRELETLSPHHLAGEVQAILLTGGSAYGLAAADGVMAWLADRGEGFPTEVAPVPLVPTAVLFDLAPSVGRPGFEEGRRACESASGEPVPEGRRGAGAGATVGKILGMEGASPGGVGSVSRPWGGGVVGALAVVNALGDVVARDGRILAGARDPEGGYLGTDAFLMEEEEGRPGPTFGGRGGELGGTLPGAGRNTTLAVVATDLPLSRVELQQVAGIAAGAFPRTISPAGTPFDGDVLFALSTGRADVRRSPAELLALGVVARDLVEEAIRRGVAPHREEDA